MTITYMDAEMRIGSPTNSMQRNDLSQWLPGLKPGEVISSGGRNISIKEVLYGSTTGAVQRVAPLIMRFDRG
jgi:hypothetical protein